MNESRKQESSKVKAKALQPDSTMPKMVHIGIGEAPRIYSNSLSLQSTPWDFKFTFGEIGRVDGVTIEVQDRAVVTMSPQHAKAMLQILATNIATYETNFGKIPIAQSPEE